MTPPIETGRTVAHYEIREMLGAGGMGEVYRARDARLDRDVAIKFLPATVADEPMRLARFTQEARAASALNHPNIVTIHEVGTSEGRPYIVMELVQGRTLRELLVPGRPLPNRQLLEYAAQAAEGIAKAHAAGIVHRDLKPENLMITRDGFVKILDFGLAKLTNTGFPRWDAPVDTHTPTQSQPPFESPATAEGSILGTAGYMSPEQARGSAADYRADQFSLGSILYEMATGRRAFKRESPVQTLSAIIEAEPPPIQSLNPAAPPVFSAIVGQCLKKGAADRYGSTLDLARELRWAREQTNDTDRSGTSQDGMRARRWRAALVGALALVVASAYFGRAAQWLERQLWPPLPAERRLAVLPFENSSGNSQSQAFCDGLAEILTRKLTQLGRFPGGLWVVPASDVRSAGVVSPALARRAVGATVVLTGRAERTEDRVRIAARLIDATSQRLLRSLDLDSSTADLASLEDRLVRRVAEMLEVDVGTDAQRTLSAGRTSVAGAWELYVEGRGHLQRYEDEASLARAISTFQAALQKDTGYPLAYAGMGEAHALRYQLTKDPQSIELAQRSCDRALALNDLLAPVHVTLGLLHIQTGQAGEAVKDLERALALDPASASALSALGQAQEALGDLDAAEATYTRAIERSPDFWGHHSALGALFFRRGRYPEAEKEFRRVIELTPDNARGYANLGGVLQTVGRDDEAAQALERAIALRPSYVAASNLGSLLFDRGDYAGAVRALEQATRLDGRDYRVWRSLGAAYHWAPGERGKAEGAYREAASRAEAHIKVNARDASALVALADCLAMLGDSSRARALAERALALSPDDLEVMQSAGAVFEQLGDRGRALRWINQALARGYPAKMIEHDPSLEALRSDPAFQSTSRNGSPPPRGATPDERRKR